MMTAGLYAVADVSVSRRHDARPATCTIGSNAGGSLKSLVSVRQGFAGIREVTRQERRRLLFDWASRQ